MLPGVWRRTVMLWLVAQWEAWLEQRQKWAAARGADEDALVSRRRAVGSAGDRY